MKNYWNLFSTSLNLILLVFFSLWLLNIPKPSSLDIANAYDNEFEWVEGSDLIRSFQSQNQEFNAMLSQIGFIKPFELEQQIASLDTSYFSSDSLQYAAFIEIYTTELYNLDSSKFSIDSAQHVLNRINWAQNFESSALVSKKNTILFKQINGFWLQKISNWLNRQLDHQYNIQYSFDYQYLANRLGENRYFSGVKGSDFDKVIINITEGKFSYLWSKLTHKSIVLQLVFFLGLTILCFFTILGVVHVVGFIQKKIKTRK